MTFELNYFLEMFPIILTGFKNTVAISSLSLLFSVLLGLVLAVVRHYRVPVLQQLSAVFTSFFRSTPFIAQLFVFYYGLSQVFASVKAISSYWSTIIVLSLSFAAYMSENIRGAIASIERGQFEAGISIGLTPWQTVKRIIIPQAARVALPGMANSFANLFKSTSLCFTVGVMDMTAYAKNRVNLNFRYLEGYVALLLIYWVILALVNRGQAMLEAHMNKPYAQEAK